MGERVETRREEIGGKEKMKSYKGFEKDMTCRGKQYKEGETYTETGASCCNYGMHACEYPLDVFGYYPPGRSVYHEVEQDGELSRDGDDTKVASTVLKVGARLDIPGLVLAAIEYTKSHTTMEHTDPKMATAGYRGAATAGDSGAATAGDSGAATAGDSGAATAGNYGAATSRGQSASGKNGLSVARGNGVKVKGCMGAVLVIAEEKKDSYDILNWKAVVVDGEKIKADTWYMLKDGELVEDGEDNGTEDGANQ